MQQRLKPFRGSARARVFATESLDEVLVAVDDTFTAFHMRLGREPAAAFASALERKVRPWGRWFSRHTSRCDVDEPRGPFLTD